MFRFHKDTYEEGEIPTPKQYDTVNKWKDELSLLGTNVGLFYTEKKLHIVTSEILRDINYIIPFYLLNEIIQDVKISDKIPHKSFGYIITKDNVFICLHRNDSHTYYTVNEDELAYLLYTIKAYILISNQKSRLNKNKEKFLCNIWFPKTRRNNSCFVLTKQQLIQKKNI